MELGPEMALGRRVALTSKAMQERADRVLAPHQASLTTWIVLNAANHSPPVGLSQSELAGGLGIGGPALVRHLDRLEAEGLVERRRDTADRRVTRITLTPEGRRTRRRLEKVMAEQDRAVRAQLTDNEVRVLERALAKLHRYALQPVEPGAAS